ncbi:MAG: MarR family transcriptional regulator [Bacteroidetes bacterium]|nr:MarR family transcriptional regulator [Bacteroidota bacterium]
MAQPSKKELVGTLITIIRLSSSQGALMGHAVAERVGLKASHSECLDLVNLYPDLTAGKLAELSGLSTGAITGIVDKLEKGGYVQRERDTKDRRKVYIRPGPAMVKVAMLYAPMAQAMERLIGTFTAEELRVLIDFHQRAGGVITAEIAALRKR